MQLPARLLRRRLDSYKGDFGHILILAGSSRFSGAAVLSAHASLRTGAGLVTIGIPKSLNNAIIKIKPAEIMTLPLPETFEQSLGIKAYEKIKSFLNQIDVIVIGPGLSRNKETQTLARKIITQINKPIVIDADGLSALAGHLNILRTAQNAGRTTVLTPHPGEMARLLGLSNGQVQAKRKDIAKVVAKDYNCIVVLKGHQTIVADRSGKLYENRTGNPGMATAGSGDVLSGMIAALLGQGLNGFDAAKYGVYLHGLAGDLAAKAKTQMGMIASDIIAKIPDAIKRCS